LYLLQFNLDEGDTKMKNIAIIAICIAALVGAAACNKPGCVIQDTLTSTLTPVIAAGLQCSNPDAIKASLVTVVQKTGMCSQQAETTTGLPSIGGEACKFVGGLLVSSVAAQAIPAEWGCTATDAKAKLAAVIAQGCAKL
jgi:hypothetical protein